MPITFTVFSATTGYLKKSACGKWINAVCHLWPPSIRHTGRMCNLCVSPKNSPCLCLAAKRHGRGHGYGALTKIRHHFVRSVRRRGGVAGVQSKRTRIFCCLLSGGSEARNALKLSPSRTFWLLANFKDKKRSLRSHHNKESATKRGKQ